MADFPVSIYDPRIVANVDGTVYEPTETTRIFAEDVNLANDEIVAIEETLGENPQGDFDTVADRLNGFVPHFQVPLLQSRALCLPGWHHAALTTSVVAGTNLYYVPIIVPRTMSFSAVSIEVTTAAGTLCRLGIYNSTDGMPSSLLMDFGTVATNSTGVKSISVSFTLLPGLYFMAWVANGHAGYRIPSTSASNLNPIRGAQLSSSAGASSYIPNSTGASAYVAGGLPSTVPFIGGTSGGVTPAIMLLTMA